MTANSPEIVNPQSSGQPAGDSTGGIIPYKNAPALIAYYTGLVSIIPGLGLVLGPIAFVLGIMGLRKRKRQPEVKGSVHAWIGIVLGFINIVIYAAVIVMIVTSQFT